MISINYCKKKIRLQKKGKKMNKTEILDEYKNQEERLLAAKILDKLEFTKTKNKIQYTDFLNLSEQELAMKLLKTQKYDNYYFFGGKENLERKILVIYPEKLTEEMSRKNDNKIMSIIIILQNYEKVNIFRNFFIAIFDIYRHIFQN